MNKNLKCLFALISSAFLMNAAAVSAKTVNVGLADVAKTLKTAQPGDSIIISNGVYENMDLKWKGTGSEKAPIVIIAETPGQVVISGLSHLKLAGEWLHIEGLNFRDGYSKSGTSVIEYKLGDDVANNCRVTNCAVYYYNPPKRSTQYSFVVMYGRNNRFDHSILEGKLNFGVTFIVMLNEERSLENNHRIDHNYFGYRPVYGSNGAETIRVGTSQSSYKSSNTIIEENIFDRCNGEVEVISIKSSDNIIRKNTFIECEGVLALRHGDRNLAEDNIFIGNGKRNTGGIRIVNAGHIVRNNVMQGLAGGRFFSALALMNAVPNSLPNRYCLVEDVAVTGNVFIDCTNIEFGTGKDLERTLPPERVLFADNVIVNTKLDEPFIAIDDVAGFTFKNNKVQLASKPTVKGFSEAKNIKLPDVNALRLKRSEVGTSWEDADNGNYDDLAVASLHKVAAGDDLPAIVDAASDGDVIILTASGGDYAIQRALVINKRLTIEAAHDLEKRPVVRFNGTKKDNMVTIADGADLVIKGISFWGFVEDGKASAAAGISTAADMITPYNLTIENCEFYEYGEGGFFAVKGTKDTFAEKVVIRNSIFRDLSGDAINYAAERDDIGRYNADDMIIENCSFYRLLGLGINIYRGGSDESTAGPYIEIHNCNFEDVCNKERGSAMRLIGPQVMNVSGCNFSNSGRGGASIRLDEATWEKVAISNCNFWNSGKIVTMTGNVVKGEMTSIEPIYRDSESYDFRMAAGSQLANKGIGVK